jgi:hypothetical protein
MSMISPHALAILIHGKAEGEMVHVRVKDPTGHRYGGRVLAMQEVKDAPRASTVDVEAEDGDVCWAVPVHRVIAVDVRPFRRYDGYGTAQFVAEVGPGVS